MLRIFIAGLCILIATNVFAQSKLDKLTVEKIMRDPKWIGTSPSGTFWSYDSKTLYFLWNPEKAFSDSVYYVTKDNKTPVKATPAQKVFVLTDNNISYNNDRSAFVYSKEADIFFTDTKTGKTKRITQTTDAESNPQFSFNQARIVFSRGQNLYAWDIATGETLQLTNIRTGETAAPVTGPRSVADATTRAGGSQQEQWLKNDQLQYFQVLRERKEKREKAEEYSRNTPRPKALRSINIEDKFLQGLNISPDGRFISYRLFKPAAGGKSTIVPNYVTETGFTTDIPGRTKVGIPQGTTELFIYDREKDTVMAFKTDSIPGIRDLPDYVKDYPKELERRTKNPVNRPVTIIGPSWSPRGSFAVIDIRSQDNKDRWLMVIDTATGKLKLLDRQRDEAWIDGPGIGVFGGQTTSGWIDENTLWYQSETTGYSHLYTVNVASGIKKALTSGKYEVQQANLSKDKKYFYIITNEVHPGEQHFYRLTIADGRKEKITAMTGANQVNMSPDEKYLAIRYSYSTKPWELYWMENKVGGKIEQLTNKAQSDEFSSYAWRDPELITFAARDGANVYARVYKPANPHPGKPAVIFVHGAGYLQNAHKWWSSYFREYMFNNLLADNGYYVMDIDYRGSSGYGRDWRTGIYRHMGGKDLTDNVDAANYLGQTFGVDPKRIGIYGGSYGGFITLMALFTTPDAFAAGAALRPVTDWAQYNHEYTSNILNEPYTDSIAYRKSSPLYYAEGLRSHLLICHGMIDVNVHFQDAVKLGQRLIELGKDNWEMASYPLEEHGFVEPSSWTDEYKRIFKLFETVLKK
jgi:dipeptidyl aminopeptidase/acylaminoacyl peptidase